MIKTTILYNLFRCFHEKNLQVNPKKSDSYKHNSNDSYKAYKIYKNNMDSNSFIKKYTKKYIIKNNGDI